MQVNVLEPHPSCSILATAGLDHQVKIWEPIGEKFSNKDHLEEVCQDYPVAIYFFKVSNGNIRIVCEVCLKSTTKTPERGHCRLSGISVINFKQISHIVLVFPLLALSK